MKRNKPKPFDQLRLVDQLRYYESEGFLVGHIHCRACGVVERDTVVRPEARQKVFKCYACSAHAGEFRERKRARD